MPDGPDRLVGGWPFTANPPLGTGPEISVGGLENVTAYEDDPFRITDTMVKPGGTVEGTARDAGFFFSRDWGGGITNMLNSKKMNEPQINTDERG